MFLKFNLIEIGIIMIIKSGKELGKWLLVSSVFVMPAFLSQSALADIKVRAGTSSVNYSAEMVLANKNFNRTADINGRLIGITFIRESGLYLDVSMSAGQTAGKYPHLLGGAPADTTFHTDIAWVVGKAYVDEESGLAKSIFIGYKTSRTEIDGPQVSNVPAAYKFNTSGLVVGGGISKPLEIGGSVGVNGGVGVMRMIWEENYFAGTPTNATSDLSYGYSLGASYTYPFSSAFGVALDYKTQSYNLKFSTGTGPSLPTTIVEKVSALGLSLYGQF